jgi:hypothetical protein
MPTTHVYIYICSKYMEQLTRHKGKEWEIVYGQGNNNPVIPFPLVRDLSWYYDHAWTPSTGAWRLQGARPINRRPISLLRTPRKNMIAILPRARAAAWTTLAVGKYLPSFCAHTKASCSWKSPSIWPPPAISQFSSKAGSVMRAWEFM